MSTVIKIENLWKEYRLGVIGHGTLTMDLQSWWAKVRGKEDPNSSLPLLKGQENQVEGDRFWALQDINIEIKKGEVLGIIGKNGAGKSTLLKILSRVTTPTRGNLKIKGRIASLLEVGTGFHPELTGRENIFMNGSILGMSKKEIAARLDEIIDFSGVEIFIDTPVKRYSSGMKVRLGFAVAAHLEPEILIVDEVLAVGDAEFQKKCLGKMQNVSSQGRTIIFVSHNMQAIRRLCPLCIMLGSGCILQYGDSFPIIESYLSSEEETNFQGNITREMHSSENEILGLEVFKFEMLTHSDNDPMSVFYDEDYVVRLHYKIHLKGNYYLSLLFRTMEGYLIAGTTTRWQEIIINQSKGHEGTIDVGIKNSFAPGIYIVQVLVKREREKIDLIDGIVLTVKDLGLSKNSQPGEGVTTIDANWLE